MAITAVLLGAEEPSDLEVTGFERRMDIETGVMLLMIPLGSPFCACPLMLRGGVFQAADSQATGFSLSIVRWRIVLLSSAALLFSVQLQ